MIDWIWSTTLYGSAILIAAGLFGLVWPTKWLHRKSRRRALVMIAIGVAGVFSTRAITPGVQVSAGQHGIDEFMPRFQFREYHETMVAAPPERVFAAIKAVTASEIALYKAFTWIRRGGEDGPEGLLNAPDSKPIFEVAVGSGFMLLLDRPPQEVVIGAVLVAPPGTRRPDTFAPDDFKRMTAPGFASVTLNFRAEATGPGQTRLSTDTRVFSTDQAALRVFTPYWRTIFPGSAILRLTWLRAIKARAERTDA